MEGSLTAISRAVVIELSREGLAGTPLNSALGRSRVNAKTIHLVPWDSEHLHRTQLLPPMTATDRSLFLERELAREGGPPKAIASQVLRQVEDGARKDEVLVVAAPREGLDRLLAPFLAPGLTPRLVVTAPLALVRAAQALSPIPADRPTLVGHWGLSGLTFAVVAEGVLKLARQIPRLAVPGLDPLEWVVTEIQRSVRAYAQISKGGRVETMLFGNAETDVERVFADPGQLETRLGIPVLNLNETLRSRLPAGVEEETGLPAGVFLLPFGAALLSPEEVPNLLPPAIIVGRRSQQITRTALAAAVLLALTLGWGFWGATQEAAALRRDLQRQEVAKRARQAALGEVEGIQAERQRVRHWIRFLSDDLLGSPPLADALKEVSRLAPDWLRLERLSVSKGEGEYTLKLAGSLKQADLAQAQAAFNRFYFGLRDSPLFYDVTFLPEAEKKKEGVPSVVEGRRVADIRPQEASTREAVGASKQQLNFELTLRLKEMR